MVSFASPFANGPDDKATGRIRALQSRTGRYRPAPGGVSIGHRDVTAGTLGCLVRKDGDLLILSNNHTYWPTATARALETPCCNPRLRDSVSNSIAGISSFTIGLSRTASSSRCQASIPEMLQRSARR